MNIMYQHLFSKGGSLLGIYHFWGVLNQTSQMNTFVYFYKFDVGNIIMFVINCFIGIGMMVCLAVSIQKNKILEYIGRNTLPIMFVHFYMQHIYYFLINKLIPSLKIELGEYAWSMFPYCLTTFMFVTIASILWTLFVNRYIPSLIGKGKFKIITNDILNKI